MDLNYRARLWSPREALEELFPHLDVVLGALRDVQLLFGTPQGGQAMAEGPSDSAEGLHDAAGTAQTFAAAYGLPLVVLTLAGEGALAWDGVLAWDGANQTRHPVFPTQVVDRIGAGDAFAAGFYFGWLAEGGISPMGCAAETPWQP